MRDDRRGRDFGNNLRARRWWRRAADDVQEEMRLHVDLRASELEAGGATPAEARDRAEREVGRPSDVAPVVSGLAGRADRRDAVGQWSDELRADLRYAWRSCRRAPGFTFLTVWTIAIGLGANAAIFGMMNVAVFTPLPFDRDGTLVRVREYRATAAGARVNIDASRRTADAVRARPDLFVSSVALSGAGRTLAMDAGAMRVAATRVGSGFADVVGVRPVLGRSFTPDEEQSGEGSGVVLVSHAFWQNTLGGSPSVLGRTVRLDGQPFEIVGVLPPRFHVPYRSDLWFPSRFGETERSIFLLARLAPGVSLETARAALEMLGRQNQEQYPDELRGLGATAVDARDYFVNNEDRFALLLMGAVALLLLIGGTNVAVLLTTKFAARADEVAVRAALGCSRARQLRQFVTEGLLLFVAGGGLGLLLAYWLKDALVVLLPEAIATQVGIDGIPLDWSMVIFATVVSVASGLAFGLVAARRVSSGNLGATMKAGGRAVAGSAVRGTLGRLVVTEVALAIVLLTLAGAMVETFRRLQSEDLGFRPGGVLTLRFDLSADRYGSADARRSVIDRILDRVRALPGAPSAGLTTVNPVCCGNWGMRVSVEGQPLVPADQTPVIQHFIVSPGYLETLSHRLVEGRALSAADIAGAEPVVVVDRALGARFWPGESALGKRIKRGTLDSEFPWLTVVGVIETTRHEGEYTEAWYLPFAQNATGPSATNAHLMARVAGDSRSLAPAIRAIISDIDPELALYEVSTMDALVAGNLRQDRLGAVVSTLFALGGLLLAALGIYGVLGFAVNADRREIGVRLALGASRLDVLRLVVGRGLRLTMTGIAVGAAVAYAVAFSLARVVPEVRFDVRLVGVAILVLLAASMVAMLAPTRRALRVDPLRSLRAD